MNQLFNCKNIKWNGVEYEELPDEELVATFADDDEDEEEDEEQQETQEDDEEE